MGLNLVFSHITVGLGNLTQCSGLIVQVLNSRRANCSSVWKYPATIVSFV